MTARDCEAARRALDRLLDGEPPGAEGSSALDAHLARCANCRRLGAELDEVRSRLREIELQPLPHAALQAVWDRTVRAERPAAGRSSVRRAGWFAAAAAVIAFVVLSTAVVRRASGPAEPTAAELREASAQSRLVLGLTARAMRRTEQLAVREVLGRDVSGALARVPVEWPAADGAAGEAGRSER